MPRKHNEFTYPAEKANKAAVAILRAGLEDALRFEGQLDGEPYQVVETRRNNDVPVPTEVAGLAPGTANWPPRVSVQVQWAQGKTDLELWCHRMYTTVVIMARCGPQELVCINVGGRLQEWDDTKPNKSAIWDGTASLATTDGELRPKVDEWSRRLHEAALRNAFRPLKPGAKWYILAEPAPSSDPKVMGRAFIEQFVRFALIKQRGMMDDAPGWEGESLWNPPGDASPPVITPQRPSPGTEWQREKLKSISSMPGGQQQYFTTLCNYIRWIRQGPAGRLGPEIRQHLASAHNVHGDRYAGVVAQIPKTLGYLADADGMTLVTPDGIALLASNDRCLAFRRLEQRVTGIAELLRIIATAAHGDPVDIAQQNKLLKAELGANWASENSTTWRRNWLWSLGLVQHTPDGDELTDVGRAELALLSLPAATAVDVAVVDGPDADYDADAAVALKQGADDLSGLTTAAVEAELATKSIRLPERTVAMAAAALRAGKHLLLVGPPGTGKTELSQALARVADQIGACRPALLATASADWTTFDTIGGYVLQPVGGGQASKLTFRPGCYLRALADQQWLIIDELNRADIDKAFGELMTVLSGHSATTNYIDDNGNAIRVIAACDLAKLRDATNTYTEWGGFRVVASMNTLDKSSLFKLSYAIQRRFAVVYVDIPDDAVFSAILDAQASTCHADSAALEQVARIKTLFTRAELLALRPIGPAVARDMVKYCVERSGSTAAAEAIELYLLPQLEGLAPKDAPKARAALEKAAAVAGQAAKALAERIADYLPTQP